MAARKQIQPGEKLPLRLTIAERKLIVELLCLDNKYEALIRATPTGQSVMMTLDELDDFGGYIAAETNHCDGKKQKALDGVFGRIQKLLERDQTISLLDAKQSKIVTDQAGRTAETVKPKRRNKVDKSVAYQFKITLLGIKPPIWRRIQLQDCTLDRLHEYIQTAMG